MPEVANVERYREHAPENRFLTLPLVREQLNSLADDLQIQAMVATLTRSKILISAANVAMGSIFACWT